MRKAIAFLRVQDNHVEYNISLYSKYTIITGFSGTGKSQLLSTILSIFALDESADSTDSDNPESHTDFRPSVVSSLSVNIITDTFRPIDSYTTAGWLESLACTFSSGSILCVDEDFKYLHTKSFQTAMRHFEALFIIVCRDKLEYLPYGVQDIFTLQLLDNGIKHYNKCSYDNCKYSSCDFEAYSSLCTEDSKSGCEFFKKFICNVSTSYGKTRIPQLIKSSKDTVFCIDGLGFGKEFLDVVESLDKFRCNHNTLWVIDSFESLILQSDWFKMNGVSRTPSVLEENLEQASTSLLSEILWSAKIHYSKSKLPECFVKDCCYKPYANAPKFRCGLFCPGDKFELILGKELVAQLVSAFGDARVSNDKIPALVGVKDHQTDVKESIGNLRLEYEEIPDEESKDSKDEKDSSDELNTDLFTNVF